MKQQRDCVYAYGDSGDEVKLMDPSPELKAMYAAVRKSKALRSSIPYSTEVAKGLMRLKWKFTYQQAMDVFKLVVNLADKRGVANLTDQERECCCFACKRLDEEHESQCLAYYFKMVDNGYPYCDCKRSLNLLECEQSILLLNRALACAPEDDETMCKLSRRYHRLHNLHREAGRTEAAAQALQQRDTYLDKAVQKGFPEALRNKALLDLCSDSPTLQSQAERALLQLPPKQEAWRMRLLIAKAHWLRGDKATAERLSGKHLRDLTGFPTNISTSNAMEQYFTLELG